MPTRHASPEAQLPPSRPSRVIVDAVLPQVDAGRYPVKRTPGEPLRVTAHLVADGHDFLQAALLVRTEDAETWSETPFEAHPNDEYTATVVIDEVGRYRYTVEAWIDAYGSWAADLEKRLLAGWQVESELLEGAALVRGAGGRASMPAAAELQSLAERLADDDVPQDERARVALEADTLALVQSFPDRSNAARYERELTLTVDRERARFGTWYEFFPRSQGTERGRGATLREAARRLPEVAAMGFDVLYLPPVHPIGSTARKGPNNALAAVDGDPGSPWAIGSEHGGHDAIEPALGTLEDFDWFVEEARGHGLEIALDIAFQCSPDHPYVREHPEWFRHRADGSIKYAENPPKQYQDVYPLDFETPEWESLWLELLRVFEFWAEHGVLIFRVDNPHTKPFRFWEWLIAEVKSRHPEAIFLAEAFTRPKRMYALAKLGFDQSYTYFTWRNTKTELTEYFTELSTSAARDVMRPNLFANTPDILHEYLQVGGRPAFLVRAVLAATLGPNYGIYSGFELCEGEAVPGTEEYLDSDKYQVKVRDWDAPGHIKDELTRLNRLRRETPALQYLEDVWFLPVANEHIVAYLRRAPEGNRHVLVIVNVDVVATQEGYIGVPLAVLGLDPTQPYEVYDALYERTYTWAGEWNFVRLDPRSEVAHVLVIESPEARS